MPIRIGRPVACVVGDLGDDRLLLVLDRVVDPVGLVLAHARLVRRDHRHPQLVELAQLLGDRRRGAGHAAHGLVAADQALHADRVEHLAALRRAQPLLGLDRGLQPVGPALAQRDPAARGVDQVDLAVPDDVVDVALEQRVRVQRGVDGGEPVAVLTGVQVDPAERLLHDLGAARGEPGVAAVLVALVVRAGPQRADDLGDLGVGLRVVGRAGEHERHLRLVDEHRVGLVDQHHVRRPADHAGHVGAQPVAQHVEADLADRPVGDVLRVRRAPLLLRGGLADPADRDAEQLVDRAHPLRVAAGQVVVHRHHVDWPALQGVPGRGERARERLSLTGGHLHDVPGEQLHRTEQLHVVGALVERPACRLPAERTQLGHFLLAEGVRVAQCGRGLGQLLVGELLDLGLAPLDRLEQLLVTGDVDGGRTIQEPAEPVLDTPHERRHPTLTSSLVFVVPPCTVTVEPV